MSDESFTTVGCLAVLIAVVIVLPLFLVGFIYSPPTTIAFTIFAAAIFRYTWQDWKHFFIDSSEQSNNYTRNSKAIKPVREEVEVITRMLLGNPDLDCKSTKGNKLTIKESIDIHYKRLNKYGRSEYDGDMEYMGPRGGIYVYTARGNRSYR